jgi:PCFT/HCP family folate transporter-like MFS transporter 1/3
MSVSSYAIIVILSIQTLSNCLVSTIGQYVYAFYLQTYPIPSNDTTTSTVSSFDFLKSVNEDVNTCPQSDISPNKDAQAWAQQRSADLFFWINLMSSCPVIIMTYLLGLYIPKLGKRFVLILPMVGVTSQLIIWLSIIYFHLPEFWWYIAAVLIGLSGSGGVLGMLYYVVRVFFNVYLGLTLNLIITENTIESERSAYFVRLGAMQTALSAIVTFSSGYYIGWRGFTDLYWIALSLQLISIITVIFFFKSADTNLDERTPLLSSINDEVSVNHCSHFFEVCTVFRFNRRSKKKSISLYLTLFSNIFFILALSSLAPFLWFLLNTPFCWTSKDVGNYSALGAISAAILSLLGMQVLTYARASDAIICVISPIFFCAACLWNAFARFSWQLYVGLFINAFSGYQGSLTVSMMSKWLEPYERNNAFTFVTEINTIISVFGSSLFNWIYARTVVNHRNFTLLLAAGLGVIPFILNM